MKIIVTGSLGNISKPLTKELVQKGHTVTVISSKPEREKEIEELGATAAIGSVEDADFLTSTFTGADVVYAMVPPHDFSDRKVDLMARYRNIGENYVHAIKQSGVKRLVYLSSVGAHLDKGTGIVLGHHNVEGILNNLSDVDITIMRPAAFYNNLFGFIDGIKKNGMMASNFGANDKILWVSPKDIAAAIVEEIETLHKGKKIRYVASDELTCNEAASVLGEAIGKPDLKWIVIPDEQLLNGLEATGMSKQVAAALVEMQACMHNGKFLEDYCNNEPASKGNVKLKDFAKDFAAAFNK